MQEVPELPATLPEADYPAWKARATPAVTAVFVMIGTKGQHVETLGTIASTWVRPSDGLAEEWARSIAPRPLAPHFMENPLVGAYGRRSHNAWRLGALRVLSLIEARIREHIATQPLRDSTVRASCVSVTVVDESRLEVTIDGGAARVIARGRCRPAAWRLLWEAALRDGNLDAPPTPSWRMKASRRAPAARQADGDPSEEFGFDEGPAASRSRQESFEELKEMKRKRGTWLKHLQTLNKFLRSEIGLADDPFVRVSDVQFRSAFKALRYEERSERP